MRINKFVALALQVARRAADTIIINNEIMINGKVARNGQDVDETSDYIQHLQEDGSPSVIHLPKGEKPTILLMNKPSKIVTSHEREGGNKTVFDILPEKYKHFKFAGRLDLMSEGLLVLSNDGGVVQTLSHPRYGHAKKYIVITEKKLNQKDLEQLQSGVEIDGYMTRPAKIYPLMQSPTDYKKFEFLGLNIYQPTYVFVLQEGRNQQIRKMLFSVNTRVKRLIRVEFGNYSLNAKMMQGQLQEMEYKAQRLLMKNDRTNKKVRKVGGVSTYSEKKPTGIKKYSSSENKDKAVTKTKYGNNFSAKTQVSTEENSSKSRYLGRKSATGARKDISNTSSKVSKQRIGRPSTTRTGKPRAAGFGKKTGSRVRLDSSPDYVAKRGSSSPKRFR